MTTFLHSLKQRKLVQWTLAYLAGSWLLLQVADLASANYHWPEAVMHVLFALLPLGLVVTWLLAWYHGERGEQKVSSIELLLLAGVFAIGGFLIWRFALPHASQARVVANTVAPVASTSAPAPAPAVSLPASVSSAIPAKSIAVLPFENLSSDKNNGYFADGMQDLILTKLADIGDLKVISRTSTMKYASRPDDLKAVGRQLGVAAVLEGSVQKAGDQVLVNVQLIDTRTDSHLWAQSYQRTLKNIFGVEGEVAEKIAQALKAKLTATEQQQVAARMTDNPAAYDAYLRGLVKQRAASGDLKSIEKDYERAVKLDPDFAVAWARLSEIRTQIYASFQAPSVAMLAKAKQAADTAIRLNPQLGDGYLALAQYHYLGLRDMKGAVQPVDTALKLMPNNPDALDVLGEVLQRQNRWPEGNQAFLKAVELDPRSVDRLIELAEGYWSMRKYEQALQIFNRAQVIAPDNQRLKMIKVMVYLDQGDLRHAAALIAKLPSGPFGYAPRIAFDVYAGKLDAAAQILTDHLGQLGASKPPNQMDLTYTRYLYARVLDWQGRHDKAQAQARMAISGVMKIRRSPADDHALAAPISEIYSILDNKDKALHWAHRAVQANATCSVCEADAEINLAMVQARFGQVDAALAALPRLLKAPNGLSVGYLHYSPRLDPLRKDPRFQALLREYPLPVSASSAAPAGGDP